MTAEPFGSSVSDGVSCCRKGLFELFGVVTGLIHEFLGLRKDPRLFLCLVVCCGFGFSWCQGRHEIANDSDGQERKCNQIGVSFVAGLVAQPCNQERYRDGYQEA